jgi:hypothetical protein
MEHFTMSSRSLRRVERLEKAQPRTNKSRTKRSTTRRIEELIQDPYVWATRHTKTRNEHWREENRPSPYEPFPQVVFLAALFEAFDHEKVVWIEKSRDLMVSWACVAYLTFHAMTVPARGVVFQTQKEEKVVQLVEYAKCLWEHQDQILKDAFPLAKPRSLQSSRTLVFENGSYIMGIPGGADQLRSYHPWGYLSDEASFQPEAGESYNESLSVVSGKIIFNSSAGPGWYADARHDIMRTEE